MDYKITKLKLYLFSKLPKKVTFNWLLKQKKVNFNRLLAYLKKEDEITYYSEVLNINLIKFRKMFDTSLIFSRITYMDEETLNKLCTYYNHGLSTDSSSNLINGIEYCEYVIHNPEYVKLLLENDYYYIIPNIIEKCSLEELKNYLVLFDNFDIYGKKMNNPETVLRTEEVFNKFIEAGCSKYFDIFSRQLNKEAMIKLIEGGYKFSYRTVITNFPIDDTLMYLKDKDKKEFYKFITLCKLNFKSYNEELLNLTDEETKEIEKINDFISKNKLSFYLFKDDELDKNYNKFMYNDYMFSLVFENHNINISNSNFTKNEEQYISFVKKYSFCLEELIKNKKDINKYFDENGPKRNLYVDALINEKAFYALFKNDDWKNYIESTPIIENYIKYNYENGFVQIVDIRNEEDISAWFDTNGPKKELFYRALHNTLLFYKLFSENNVWRKYFNATEEEKGYIEFMISNKQFINKDTELKYFLFENNKNYKLENIIFDQSSFYYTYSKEFYNIYQIPKYLKYYIEITKNLSFESMYEQKDYFIFFKSQNLEDYFDENGPKEKFYLNLILSKYRLSNSTFEKIDIPKRLVKYKKYTSITHDYGIEYDFQEEIDRYFDGDNITEELCYDILLHVSFGASFFEKINNDNEVMNIINSNISLKNYYSFLYDNFVTNLDMAYRVSKFINSRQDIEKYFTDDFPSFALEELAFKEDINIYSSREEYIERRRTLYADENGKLSPKMELYFKARELPKDSRGAFSGYLLSREQIEAIFSNPPSEEVFKEALFEHRNLFYYLYSPNDAYDFSHIDGNVHTWNEFYHPAKNVEQYIKWSFEIYELSKFINNFEDIDKYFDDKGPTKELIEQLDPNMYSRIFKNNLDYKSLGLSPVEEKIVEFMNNPNVSNLRFITNISDAYNYFDENGPKDTLFIDMLKYHYDEFERCVYSIKNVFNELLSDNLKAFLNTYSLNDIYVITGKIDAQDFDKYFSFGKPTKDFYILCLNNYELFNIFKDEIQSLEPKFTEIYATALKDYELFNFVFIDDEWENNFKVNISTKNFINFIKKYNNWFLFDKCSSNIEKYFDENGPKSILYEEILVHGDTEVFNLIFEGNEWEKYYTTSTSVVKDYINQIKRGVTLHGLSITNIVDYISRFENAIFDKDIFFNVFGHGGKPGDNWEEVYKPEDYIVKYIKIIINSGYYAPFFERFTSKKDIYKFIVTPNKELFEYALFESVSFSILFNEDFRELYEKAFESNPKILTYIDFCKNNRMLSFCKTIDDINFYFDSDGPSINFFEKVLFDEYDFNIVFNEKYRYLFEKIYAKEPELLQYINYSLINGRTIKSSSSWSGYRLICSSKESVLKMFNEKGPSINLFNNALQSGSLFRILFTERYKKLYEEYYAETPEILGYINFIKKNISSDNLNKLLDIINTKVIIKECFDINGPTEKFIELAHRKIDLLLLLIELEYINDEVSLKIYENYNELEKKYNRYNIYGLLRNNEFENYDLNTITLLLLKNSEKLDKYLKVNNDLFATIDIRMLEERFNKIPDTILQQIFLYRNIQDKLYTLDEEYEYLDSLISILDYVFKNGNGMDMSVVVFNIINNIGLYTDVLKEFDISKEENLLNFICILQSKNNIYNISSYDDLTNKNFSVIKNKYFNENKDNCYALILKLYGFDEEFTKFLINRYCQNVEYLKNSGIDRRYINILINIYDIVNGNKSKEELKFLYNILPQVNIDYKTCISFELLLRNEFAKEYSKTLYKVNPEHSIDEHPELIENERILSLINSVSYNGSKPKFYMMNGDFNLQIHVLGAYREFYRPENFQENWNMPKIANHGICTSYLGNDQIASARQYHPALAFQEYDGDEMLLCGPYDLGSKNTDFASTMEMAGYFIPPEEMINNTRHTHNEIVLERKKIIHGQIKKRQPNYLILFVDDINNEYNFKKVSELSADEASNDYKKRCAQIYEETVQASIDFGIPIVIVDRLKYAKEERRKCDELLTQYKENLEPTILKKFFLKLFNNRVACHNFFEGERMDYCLQFDDKVLDAYINDIINFIESLQPMKKYECYKLLLECLLEEKSKSGYSGSEYIIIIEDKISKISTTKVTKYVQEDNQDKKYKILNKYFNKSSSEIQEKMIADFTSGLSVDEILDKVENGAYSTLHR